MRRVVQNIHAQTASAVLHSRWQAWYMLPVPGRALRARSPSCGVQARANQLSCDGRCLLHRMSILRYQDLSAVRWHDEVSPKCCRLRLDSLLTAAADGKRAAAVPRTGLDLVSQEVAAAYSTNMGSESTLSSVLRLTARLGRRGRHIFYLLRSPPCVSATPQPLVSFLCLLHLGILARVHVHPNVTQQNLTPSASFATTQARHQSS